MNLSNLLLKASILLAPTTWLLCLFRSPLAYWWTNFFGHCLCSIWTHIIWNFSHLYTVYPATLLHAPCWHHPCYTPSFTYKLISSLLAPFALLKNASLIDYSSPYTVISKPMNYLCQSLLHRLYHTGFHSVIGRPELNRVIEMYLTKAKYSLRMTSALLLLALLEMKPSTLFARFLAWIHWFLGRTLDLSKSLKSTPRERSELFHPTLITLYFFIINSMCHFPVHSYSLSRSPCISFAFWSVLISLPTLVPLVILLTSLFIAKAISFI